MNQPHSMTRTDTTRQDAPTTGLWLIGARGSVATTAVVGLLALRAGIVPATGCVTGRAPLDAVPLVPWENIRVGGHDIVDTPLEKRAEMLVDSGVIPQPVLEAVRRNLPEVEDELRTGYDPKTHT